MADHQLAQKGSVTEHVEDSHPKASFVSMQATVNQASDAMRLEMAHGPA